MNRQFHPQLILPQPGSKRTNYLYAPRRQNTSERYNALRCLWPRCSLEKSALVGLCYPGQMIHDLQALRTGLLALAAADTGRRLSAGSSQALIVRLPYRQALTQRHLISVIEGKVIGDGNIPGAASYAVAAGRALHRRQRTEGLRHFSQQSCLLLCQRLEIRHKASVVCHLGHVGHTAEDYLHLRKAGSKADGPGGRGPVGVDLPQQLLRLRR